MGLLLMFRTLRGGLWKANAGMNGLPETFLVLTEPSETMMLISRLGMRRKKLGGVCRCTLLIPAHVSMDMKLDPQERGNDTTYMHRENHSLFVCLFHRLMQRIH